MPTYKRAEISADLTVTPSRDGEQAPREQIEAVRRAAGESGLANESGPGSLILAGGRTEVLEALSKVLETSFDVGASVVEIKVEAEKDAPSFEGGG
jgi:uncharacterized protein YqgV (UPF0045/DUF77 family)